MKGDYSSKSEGVNRPRTNAENGEKGGQPEALKGAEAVPELSHETEGTNYPVCPVCGAVDEDWWDGLTIEVNDGTEWPAHCHDCGADYSVAARLDITFSTTPTGDQPDAEVG